MSKCIALLCLLTDHINQQSVNYPHMFMVHVWQTTCKDYLYHDICCLRFIKCHLFQFVIIAAWVHTCISIVHYHDVSLLWCCSVVKSLQFASLFKIYLMLWNSKYFQAFLEIPWRMYWWFKELSIGGMVRLSFPSLSWKVNAPIKNRSGHKAS